MSETFTKYGNQPSLPPPLSLQCVGYVPAHQELMNKDRANGVYCSLM